MDHSSDEQAVKHCEGTERGTGEEPEVVPRGVPFDRDGPELS